MSTETLIQDAAVRSIHQQSIKQLHYRSALKSVKIEELDLSQTAIRLKRIIDFTLSLIGIIILSPFLAVISLLVSLTSPGPVIYKSLRVGQDKKPFYMYKFRTMVQNAEKQRATLYERNNLDGQLFKLKNDNRITPIGTFLRKYSIDEFPQLFNVLKGEMSLVGPRPYIPEESKLFEYPYTARYKVIPGMTGPWQVSGRSDLTFEQLCDLELGYVTQWSLWLDFKILLKTLPCVLLKKGAY